MKYETNHTLSATLPDPRGPGDLTSQKSHVFKRGEIVTEAQLTEWGFDVQHLLGNGAVEELKGTEDDREARRNGPPAPPTTTGDATPNMATAPKGEPETQNPRERAQANRETAGQQPKREPSRVHEEKADPRK